MATKPIVRLDRVLNGHIDSFRVSTELNQGTVVSLGDLGADDTYVGGVVDLAKPVVFHCTTPMTYKNSDTEDQFALPANAIGRGYCLSKDDMVTITNDGVSGTPAKGKILGLEVGKNVMKIYADMTALNTAAASGLAFRCESITESLSGQPASLYRVVRV